jgi:ABC-type proline/glycine betaine transport system permease subunit
LVFAFAFAFAGAGAPLVYVAKRRKLSALCVKAVAFLSVIPSGNLLLLLLLPVPPD